MSAHKLNISGKIVSLHSSIMNPDFRTPTVLCSDPWDFVSLWLKKKHKYEAQFYWDQAKTFFEASKLLPSVSAPLTSYYCFLNATKSLLSSKEIGLVENHGVAGNSLDGHKSLSNEIVEFKGSGILPALCEYLSEYNNAGSSYTLKQLFWQMPFIHRAYCLSFRGATELFLPLENICFMRKDRSKEAWFQAELHPKYINAHINRIIKPGFELYNYNSKYYIRRKRRFRWSSRGISNSLDNFKIYHKQIRSRIIPIYSNYNRWYLKKSVNNHDIIKNSNSVLIFAAMHRLSELSRYDPMSLMSHFNVNHNWLLSEFIKNAPTQFVYSMASEITGLEFIRPNTFLN